MKEREECSKHHQQHKQEKDTLFTEREREKPTREASGGVARQSEGVPEKWDSGVSWTEQR